MFDFSRSFRGVNTDFLKNFSDIFLISLTSDPSDFLLNHAVCNVSLPYILFFCTVYFFIYMVMAWQWVLSSCHMLHFSGIQNVKWWIIFNTLKMNLSNNIELSPNSNVMLKNVSVCNRIIVMTGNKQAYSTKTTMLLASEKLYLVSRLLYYGDEVSLKQTYYGI